MSLQPSLTFSFSLTRFRRALGSSSFVFFYMERKEIINLEQVDESWHNQPMVQSMVAPVITANSLTSPSIPGAATTRSRPSLMDIGSGLSFAQPSQPSFGLGLRQPSSRQPGFGLGFFQPGGSPDS